MTGAHLNCTFCETVLNLSKFQIKLRLLFRSESRNEVKTAEVKPIISTSGQ